MRFLITGTAGFIGFHLAKRLLDDGHFVVGYDGITDYYDRRLKQDRHAILCRSEAFCAVEAQLEDAEKLIEAADLAKPDIIIHLAAQAGVRYSIEHPRTYIESNLVGSYNLLEVAKRSKPKHLFMASTSSVYGGNEKMPFDDCDKADFPVSLYAATKKATEVMSHAYAHLWGLPTTCFRFFTVYGPWGRPDMALFKFVSAILSDEPITIYGGGAMRRDFTYIDDLIEAIVRLIDFPPVVGHPVSAPGVGDTLSPVAPWRAVNVGGGVPVDLPRFVEAIEKAIGVKAKKVYLPMQPGDVRDTYASHHLLEALTGFRPSVPVERGVAEFVHWYREYTGR